VQDIIKDRRAEAVPILSTVVLLHQTRTALVTVNRGRLRQFDDEANVRALIKGRASDLYGMLS